MQPVTLSLSDCAETVVLHLAQEHVPLQTALGSFVARSDCLNQSLHPKNAPLYINYGTMTNAKALGTLKLGTLKGKYNRS